MLKVYEVVGGAVLMFTCILIIILVLLQDNKGSGLSGAISGGDAGGMLQRGRGRARDEKRAKLTRILAIVLFVVVLAVDVIAAVAK